jgi:ubiquinone/menaquinone biosynthesis C-methylase UbiE
MSLFSFLGASVILLKLFGTRSKMTIGKETYKNYEPAGKGAGILPLVEGVSTLEIGFGSGALLDALTKRGNDVYGVDASQSLVELARGKGFSNTFHVDISEEALPFEDDKFDAVYCYEVFEHLTNPHRLFYETRRVLKRDCPFFFSTPMEERMAGYGPGRHAFVYPGLTSRENIERFFMQMYFKVEQLVEDSGQVLLAWRSYILKNIKPAERPDIVKVIAGDYSPVELYSDVLEPSALQMEWAREVEPYIKLAERLISSRRWDLLDDALSVLLKYHANYLPVYTRLAKLMADAGETETALALLNSLKANPIMSADMAQDVDDLLLGLADGGDVAGNREKPV